MAAGNVGDFILSVTYLILRDFTYEKDLMSAVNVGNSSVAVPSYHQRVHPREWSYAYSECV